MKLHLETVQRTPELAVAVQFKGGEAQAQSILAWVAEQGFPGGHFRDGPEGGAIFLATYPVVHRARIFDWVVIGEDGSLSVLPEMTFAMKWERQQ